MTPNRNAERGSALVYILIAIALLAALTVSFMEPSSQQTQSQNTFNLTSELKQQADFIRSSVQECLVMYPGGDAGALPPNPLVQHNNPFPINPTNTYLVDEVTPATDEPLVKDIRCPGNPGDDPDHQPIFSGRSGKFMPAKLPMFEDWFWYNGPDGVFFWTYTRNTDAFITSALDKLNEQYGDCEADVIRTTAAAFDMDTADTVKCPSNSQCFRVWMVTDNETAIDLGQSVYSAAEAGACP